MSMDNLTRAFGGDAKGFYNEAAAFNKAHEASIPWVSHFALKAKKEGIVADEAVYAKREEFYLRKLGVKPHEFDREQRVRQHARDTWALDKYFAEHGCPIYGPAAPEATKAFTAGSLQGVFPIFFEAAVREGLLANSIRNRLLAESVPINSGVANHVELADSASSSSALAAVDSNNLHPLQQAGEIGQGTRMTEVTVLIRDRQIPLKKFGYQLMSTYEVLRRSRLPVLQRTLARIGRGFETLLIDFMVDVLVLGDGAITTSTGTSAPSNAAATVAATAPGAPVYSDYVGFDLAFPQGYEEAGDDPIWLMNRQAIIKMLNVPEFKDPLAGFAYQNRGAVPRPFGHEVIRWDTTGGTTAWPNTATNCKILALMPSIGLTEYTEGGLISESDTIIDAQWSKTVVSQWVAYGIGDPQSRLVMTGAA